MSKWHRTAPDFDLVNDDWHHTPGDYDYVPKKSYVDQDGERRYTEDDRKVLPSDNPRNR